MRVVGVVGIGEGWRGFRSCGSEKIFAMYVWRRVGKVGSSSWRFTKVKIKCTLQFFDDTCSRVDILLSMFQRHYQMTVQTTT